MYSASSLFSEMLSLPNNAYQVSQDIELAFIHDPEIILDCLRYLLDVDNHETINKKNQIYLLFLEGFSRLRYKLDNQERVAEATLMKVHQLLAEIFHQFSLDQQVLVSEALHESKLPTPELDYDANAQAKALENMPDILPQLPALLQIMRQEGGLKTAFQLCEFLLGQFTLHPIERQCTLINELVTAEKEIIRDVGILMLMHPKKSVRSKVVLIWLKNLAEHQTKVSPINLRRLLLMRNWLPHDEQPNVDELIQQLRKKGEMPAPYPLPKITKLMASAVDGAGVQCIMFETKVKNQRSIAGFLLKEGVGVLDPYVVHKAHASEFMSMLEHHQLPFKTVSTGFVTKLVCHFIALGQSTNFIPEPEFIEIAELFGGHDWRPQTIIPGDEVQRIKTQETLDSSNPILIEQALKGSSAWPGIFVESWFETGDRVDVAMVAAQNLEKEQENSSFLALLNSVTKLLFQAPLMDKWIFTLTRMMLWHRSKSIKGEDWQHYLVIIELLLKGYPVENIPLMQEIAKRSIYHRNSVLKNLD